MEEFLETTIEESPEKAGPDFLTGQTAEDAEFRGPVDKMFDLGAVDTEEEFSMLCEKRIQFLVLKTYGGGLLGTAL